MIAEMYPDALFADGFDEAILGLCTTFTITIICYDRDACLKILMDRDMMSEDDAEEFFAFNVEGAGMGEGTPCFLTKWKGCNV